MKNKFLSSLFYCFILGAILACPLQATPYGSPDVRNLRRTQLPPDITNIPVPDENAKKCMMDAIALLIRAELEQEYIFSNKTGVFSGLAGQFKEESLPKDFALAIRTVTEKLDQIDREQRASYYDEETPAANEVVKNWLILEAISRRDLGISLEWESMKAMWRYWDLRDALEDAPEIIFEHEEDGKSWREQGFEIIAQHIPPVGYQGTASPETRKVIMDWYKKTVVDFDLFYTSDEERKFPLSPGQIPNTEDSLLELLAHELPDELQKLIKAEIDVHQKLQMVERLHPPSNEEKMLKGQLAKTIYERNRSLIDAVGMSLHEYDRKVWNQLKSMVIQKTGQNSEMTRKERNKEIRKIWREWKQNGIPDQKFPGLTQKIVP